MQEYLDEKYFNNTTQDYLIATGFIVVGILVIRIFRNIVLNRMRHWAEKTETKLDDLLVNGVERFMLPILNLILFYYAVNYLTLDPRAEKVVEYATACVITYFGIRIITSSLRTALLSYVQEQENGVQKAKQLRGITIVINIIIWCVGLILLFNNLGYNVTAIITGLGVGGIAVALAAQNILGDLFNYFVIFFDRPFEIGDFLKIDDKVGTVEYIGIKTTRIKCLSGEQLILSNSDITKSRVHNFKQMQRRRVLFSIGIVYETPLEKVRAIPELIKQIIEQSTPITFDRAHFATYGNFSLNYEIVYYVESADYNLYMDIQQNINLKIFEEFEKRGIQFAYPTQTILMNKT